MLAKGDKLVVVKRVASFLNEGDVVEVVDVDASGLISFAFGEDSMHKGVMNSSECEEYFEKVNTEKAPSVTEEYIEELLVNSDIVVDTVFDKCTIVSCRLPNGFVIVESSACVSPENYDEEAGIDICLSKIMDKLWELEGYRLQCELYENNEPDDDIYSCDYNCDECEYACEDYDEDEENDEFDNCHDDDGDSEYDECDSFNCPYNNNR